jgi:hypothetical protein
MAAVLESFNLPSVAREPNRLASHRRHKNLSAAEYSNFRELCAQYLSLDRADTHPNARTLADEVIRKDLSGQRLTLNDINSLETALVRLEPLDRVRERLRSMSSAYSRLIGEPEKLLTFDQLDEGATRARAEQLLNEIHTASIISRRNLELCSRWIRLFSLSTLMVIAGVISVGLFCCYAAGAMAGAGTAQRPGEAWVITLLLQIAWTLPYLPAIFYSMVAGAGGAFLSSLLRVQTLVKRSTSALVAIENQSALSAIITPVIGAFAGFFIFSFFATGLMQGDFMPKITTPDHAHWIAQWGGILEMGLYGQNSPIDDFKLLLAGLASGFSERLFPDMLNSLSNGLESPRSPAG